MLAGVLFVMGFALIMSSLLMLTEVVKPSVILKTFSPSFRSNRHALAGGGGGEGEEDEILFRQLLVLFYSAMVQIDVLSKLCEKQGIFL